jgi:hypothetical protein
VNATYIAALWKAPNTLATMNHCRSGAVETCGNLHYPEKQCQEARQQRDGLTKQDQQLTEADLRWPAWDKVDLGIPSLGELARCLGLSCELYKAVHFVPGTASGGEQKPRHRYLPSSNPHGPLSANRHALLPTHAGESAAPRRDSIAWPVSSSNLF